MTFKGHNDVHVVLGNGHIMWFIQQHTINIDLHIRYLDRKWIDLSYNQLLEWTGYGQSSRTFYAGMILNREREGLYLIFIWRRNSLLISITEIWNCLISNSYCQKSFVPLAFVSLICLFFYSYVSKEASWSLIVIAEFSRCVEHNIQQLCNVLTIKLTQVYGLSIHKDIIFITVEQLIKQRKVNA